VSSGLSVQGWLRRVTLRSVLFRLCQSVQVLASQCLETTPVKARFPIDAGGVG